jgi:hypothetical protein
MDGGLWHQPGQRSGQRRSKALRTGAAVGAGVPLVMAAVRLLTRHRRSGEEPPRP